MAEINGQFGGQKVFELLMDSGELVYVQPLSIYVMRALRDKSEELYPFPEKAEYEKELDDAMAIESGQTIPAEENPEYQKLYDEAAVKQSNYLNAHCIEFSVVPVIGQETLITKYKDRLKQLRKIIDVPKDDWEATLKMCVISSQQDYAMITSALQGVVKFPTEEDIKDGMRIFRRRVRQERPVGNTGDKESPGAENENPNQAQPLIGAIRPSTDLGLSDTEPDVGTSEQGRTERDVGASALKTSD